MTPKFHQVHEQASEFAKDNANAAFTFATTWAGIKSNEKQQEAGVIASLHDPKAWRG